MESRPFGSNLEIGKSQILGFLNSKARAQNAKTKYRETRNPKLQKNKTSTEVIRQSTIDTLEMRALGRGRAPQT